MSAEVLREAATPGPWRAAHLSPSVWADGELFEQPLHLAVR